MLFDQYFSLDKLTFNQDIQRTIVQELIDKWDSGYHHKNICDKTIQTSFTVDFITNIMGWLSRINNSAIKLKQTVSTGMLKLLEVDVMCSQLISVCLFCGYFAHSLFQIFSQTLYFHSK